jgi:hypothetical protein
MIDINIDDSNKLVWTSGDLVLVSDDDEIVQSIKIRLRMFLGEWFLDTREGVDYINVVYKNNYDLEEIEMEFRRIISETIGVSSILSYTQQIQTINSVRTLVVAFSVLSINNTTLTIEEDINKL